METAASHPDDDDTGIEVEAEVEDDGDADHAEESTAADDELQQVTAFARLHGLEDCYLPLLDIARGRD